MAEKAEEIAKKMREVSVAEFFEKNRHLLGFDNPAKALLTVIKEGVDNSLDACEEARILPEVVVDIREPREIFRIFNAENVEIGRVTINGEKVELKIEEEIIKLTERKEPSKTETVYLFEGKDATYKLRVYSKENRETYEFVRGRTELKVLRLPSDRFLIRIEDNGPGITREHIPKVFGKLLYGSKFGAQRQSLTGDEPILIRKHGRVQLIPIGKLIDDHIKGDEGVEGILGTEVPAFDYKAKKYAWLPVSHLIKHKRENEIVEITLESNRKIKVTGCHSLFTINDAGEIEIVEARKLSTNSRIVIPHFLPSPEEKKDTFILDYIESEWFGGKWIYVYNIDGGIFEELSKEFKVIHKITDKSRKYHRLERNGKQIDILDDSWKQYVAKGFLPLHLVYELGIKERMKESVLKTYYHGKETIVPASIEITPSLMRLLGLYTAEGHADKRQIGFTFGKHEDSLIEEITRTAREMGLNTTIEHRDRSIRVKLFGQVLVELIEKWCGKGAHNKHVPDFAFSVSQELRQHYLDALYQGDGHKVPERNQLMFSSVSSRLANEVAYLWLMQGVIASLGNSISTKGLGKNPCISYRVNLYGSSINKSFVFEANRPLKGSHLLRGQNQMLKQIYAESDLALIKVKNIRIIEEGFGSVYDLSIPNCENFVGGLGGIACHNSRGQQGIGVSAAVLYSQLTAGKPTKIWSRISEKKPVHYFEIRIDTTKNEPIILEDKTVKDGLKEHGVIVEMEIEGKFMERYHSVEEYLKQTAAINPFAKITYVGPDRSKVEYPRKVNELPPLAKSIKPHPHGVELGMLERMMKLSDARSVSSFLTKEFSRVGGGTADQLCKMANIKSATKPAELDHEKIEKLWRAIQSFPFMKPPTDCLSPIGEKAFAEGIRKEFEVEFVEAVTRPPSVYRGNPFQIEACIGYGGKLPTNEPAKLLRFANRVPLLYQASSCATVKSLQKIEWRSYGMEKQGNTPYGPVVIAIHMASVWIPYVSEAKEAIANYPEIMKEIKLAVQECGRKLYRYLSGRKRREDAAQRQSLFEKYIPEAAAAIGKLADLQKDKIQKDLEKMLKKGEVLKQEEQSAEPEAKEEKGEDNGGEE